MNGESGEIPQGRNAARISSEIMSLWNGEEQSSSFYGVCGVVVSAHLSVKQKVVGSIPPNHPNPAHEAWDCGL